MRLKASLHIHTREDTKEGAGIEYGVFDLIKWAEQCHFDVLALTCHRRFVFRQEYAERAAALGILLLPGIELALPTDSLWQAHVLVLNCRADINDVRTFDDLRQYRRTYADTLVIAPHPFSRLFSLGEAMLERHIDLFDALEHTWYYSRWFNPNVTTEVFGQLHGKPVVATSDAHFLDYFDTDYCWLEAEAKTPAAVFDAIRQGRISNVSEPKPFWRATLRMIDFDWTYRKRRALSYVRQLP